MKILKVFIDDEADEQIATSLLLFGRRQLIDSFREHRVSGPVADVTD